MGEKLDKIKTHFQENWKTYAIGTVAVVGVAVITCVVMKRKHCIDRGIPVIASRGIPVAEKSNASVLSLPSIMMGGKIGDVNVSQVIKSRRQGAPSWVVRCLETGEAFMSQRAAALAMDLSPAELSRHLNGAIENVRGFHFERICMAA